MKYYIVVFIALLITGIYLNRSYHHIYSYMGSHYKMQPTQQPYTVTSTGANNTAVYVSMGDSLTAGVGADAAFETYPYMVAQSLAQNKKSTIVTLNLGVPGAVAADVLAAQVPKALEANPSYITLLIGINDIHNLVSLKNFQNNIHTILQQLRRGTEAVITVASVPNIGVPQLVKPPFSWYYAWQIQKFNAVLKKECEQIMCSYVDITNATKNFNSGMYSQDLFHPSFAGYSAWAKLIVPSVITAKQ